MGEYTDLIQTISLTLGVAWASGINLYAAILTLGLMSVTGNIDLPPGLEVLSDPLVLFAAGAMYCVEFVADKIPGVDTGWDTLHTFVRIPAGAMVAAGAVGDMTPALNHPVLFLVLLALFVVLMIWLLPKLWRGVKLLFSKIKGLFGGGKPEAAAQQPDKPVENDKGNSG